jgi:hypothetical protein
MEAVRLSIAGEQGAALLVMASKFVGTFAQTRVGLRETVDILGKTMDRRANDLTDETTATR